MRLWSVFFVALTWAVSPAFATILTFDNMALMFDDPITNYGSNMTGLCTGSGQLGCVLQGNGFTPNIAVVFQSLTGIGNSSVDVPNTFFRDSGSGDLTNTTGHQTDGDFTDVTLTPQNGVSVKLNGFDLGSCCNGGSSDNQNVRVYNADYSVVLFSFDGSIPGTHTSFTNLNIVSTGAIHIQTGPASQVGIDNIDFDEFADPQTYQIRYAANLDKGDSTISFTNAGTLNGYDPSGRICVNIYTFDPAEELISCCTCPATPNGLYTLSIRNDVLANSLTPGTPTAVVIKMLASVPVAGVCNTANPSLAPTNLVRGLRAWGTTLHALSDTPGAYGKTETPFSSAELSVTELAKLTAYCGFIQSNGSGFGICKSCRFGSLGGVEQ